MSTADERLASIFDEAKYKALALLEAERRQAKDSSGGEPTPDWMTDVELARHWRLFNKKGEPMTAGIRSWVKRPPDEHPLPHAYMGDLLRFRREDVDRWATEASERRKIEAHRKKLHAASNKR